MIMYDIENFFNGEVEGEFSKHAKVKHWFLNLRIPII